MTIDRLKELVELLTWLIYRRDWSNALIVAEEIKAEVRK